MVRPFVETISLLTLTNLFRCEERFTGYGANKAACLFEIYLSGVDYYVLADHFLIHQSHKYEEQARKEEVNCLAIFVHIL
jgi:Glycosyl-transferase for dystroglycan